MANKHFYAIIAALISLTLLGSCLTFLPFYIKSMGQKSVANVKNESESTTLPKILISTSTISINYSKNSDTVFPGMTNARINAINFGTLNISYSQNSRNLIGLCFNSSNPNLINIFSYLIYNMTTSYLKTIPLIGSAFSNLTLSYSCSESWSNVIQLSLSVDVLSNEYAFSELFIKSKVLNSLTSELFILPKGLEINDSKDFNYTITGYYGILENDNYKYTVLSNCQFNRNSIQIDNFSSNCSFVSIAPYLTTPPGNSNLVLFVNDFVCFYSNYTDSINFSIFKNFSDSAISFVKSIDFLNSSIEAISVSYMNNQFQNVCIAFRITIESKTIYFSPHYLKNNFFLSLKKESTSFSYPFGWYKNPNINVSISLNGTGRTYGNSGFSLKIFKEINLMEV